MWDFDAVAAAAADALRAEAERLDLEQSPYGLDALEETSLHPLLAAGFRDAGFGAHTEQRYPTDRARPNRATGDRCDLVLTAESATPLIDALEAETLFGHHGVPLDEALWLEVKAAHQFALTEGVAGPSRAYASQLLSAALADARRLARDPGVAHGGALAIIFTADQATADHDIAMWVQRCLERDLPVAWPHVHRFDIADRIGNRLCAVALMRVRSE